MHIMFDGFTTFDVTVEPGVTIHGVRGGKGPALLLLHGYPQSYVIWHRVAGELAKRYSVVALDLRGYGKSSKPRGTANHDNYSKRVMADDCVQVMRQLRHDEFYVCGHDRGARVAHSMMTQYPDRVLKAMLLDISPTLTMYSETNFDFARAYFHWFFLIQPSPLPESLILGDPGAFMRCFMGSRVDTRIFDPACLSSYIEDMSKEDAVHASCEDYRASATVDLDDARADIAAGRLIRCPLHVLWGKKGVIERLFDAIHDWKTVSANPALVDGYAIDSSHYIPEECPQELLKNMFEFFQGK